MIIKIIPNPNNNRTIAKVIKYCIGAKGREDPSTWQRGEDGQIECADMVDGGRVGTVRITNCMSDDSADATREMMLVQKMNLRSRTEKYYHMVISFPPGEMVSDEVLACIEHDVCSSIGMEEHQSISVTHHDKEHLHLHVILNKVHPQTYNNINPHYPIKSLMRAADEIEQKYGLVFTNHQSQNELHGRAADMEAHSAENSLLRWVKEEVMPDIKQLLSSASSWQEIHSIFADYGLEYRLKGAGAVIVIVDNSSLAVKASSVDRSLSYLQMKQNFGDYVQPEHKKIIALKKQYVQKPLRSVEMASTLYSDYQQYRNDKVEAQRKALKLESSLQADFYAKHKAWYRQERERIHRNRAYRGVQKRTALLHLKSQYLDGISHAQGQAVERKKELYEIHGTKNWQAYLQHQAENGNQEAQLLLNRREKRQMQTNANFIHAPDLVEVSKVASEGVRSFIDKYGDTCFSFKDGGFVKRHEQQFHVIRNSDSAIGFVLHAVLASKNDNRLRLSGDESFVRKSIEILVDKDVDVILQDLKHRNLYEKLKTERINNSNVVHGIVESMNDMLQSLDPSYTIVHKKLWTSEQKGDFILHEIKEIDKGMKLGLLQQNDTLYAKVLSLTEQNALGSLKTGAKVKTLVYGRLVAKGRTR